MTVKTKDCHQYICPHLKGETHRSSFRGECDEYIHPVCCGPRCMAWEYVQVKGQSNAKEYGKCTKNNCT